MVVRKKPNLCPRIVKQCLGHGRNPGMWVFKYFSQQKTGHIYLDLHIISLWSLNIALMLTWHYGLTLIYLFLPCLKIFLANHSHIHFCHVFKMGYGCHITGREMEKVSSLTLCTYFMSNAVIVMSPSPGEFCDGGCLLCTRRVAEYLAERERNWEPIVEYNCTLLLL